MNAQHEKTLFGLSIGLNLVGAATVLIYAIMSFGGPVPLWGQVLYLIGVMAGTAVAWLERNYFSLVCFLVTAATAVYQIVAMTT